MASGQQRLKIIEKFNSPLLKVNHSDLTGRKVIAYERWLHMEVDCKSLNKTLPAIPNVLVKLINLRKVSTKTTKSGARGHAVSGNFEQKPLNKGSRVAWFLHFQILCISMNATGTVNP